MIRFYHFCADKQMAEQYKEVYRRFYAKLVQSLPMTDAHFRAALVSKQLFYGDLLDQIDAKETNAEKSAHFLTNTIDTSLNVGITRLFVNLLQVMENFDSPILRSLAHDINADLLKATSTTQTLLYTQPTSDLMQPPAYTEG